jgi:1-aminocyclopropane-1-carboxylate deaminase
VASPYAIPAGASDHPLGGLGYAHFADEIAAQEKAHSVFFDTVVVATCTGSTQAGMVVGFGTQDRKRRVIGIDTAANEAMTCAAVLIELNRDIHDEEIEIDPCFAGPDYGLPDEPTIAAIRMAAHLEAMLTDPVYEGKSTAGLIAIARSGEVPRGSEVLYVHLVGALALNAYPQAETLEPSRPCHRVGWYGSQDRQQLLEHISHRLGERTRR